MGAYKGVIGLLLNLLPVAVPPCHTAFIRAEVFYFPTDWLHHDLTAVLASFATVEFRVAANMSADGAGRDTHGQGDFGAALSLLEQLVDNFDVLFFHDYSFCYKKKRESSPKEPLSLQMDYSSASAMGVPLTFSIFTASGSTSLASTRSVVTKAT